MILAAIAALLILVPGLFWWGTWFGKRLDDDALVERLSPDAKPRHVQHGISEIAMRLDEGRPGMQRWVDELVRASSRSEASVREAAAWAMQHDTARPEFAARLREMVTEDSSPIARRNAATSLSRFGDDTGLQVLREMLGNHGVLAPAAGTVTTTLAADDPVKQGMLAVRIDLGDGRSAEVRAALPGRVLDAVVEEGATVAAGDVLLVVAPAAGHVRNAIVALALVGQPEDVATLLSLADPRSGWPEDIRRQATAAAATIEAR